jgi:hypothetical protein
MYGLLIATIKWWHCDGSNGQIIDRPITVSPFYLWQSIIRPLDTVHKQLLIPKRTTPSVKNENIMQTAPSARHDTFHKQLLIPKRTTPSVNKLN